MRPEIEFDIAEILNKPLMAHLATASQDGPRDSPVWFLWEDELLWLVGSSRDSYPKRIAEDGRCAIGIVDFDLQAGRLRHLGFRGVARIEPFDRQRLERFLYRYIGPPASWHSKFKMDIIDGLDLMIRFSPQSTVARDQSYFR